MTTLTEPPQKRLVYSRTIGLTTIRIRGFYYPWSSAFGDDGRMYVLRRCHDADPRGVHVTVVDADDEYIGTFGSFGDGEGQFVWPVSIVLDGEQRILISDEQLNRITLMSAEGEYITSWGTSGTKPGELDGPSGLAIDSKDELLVVDSRNSRVQRFTLDGSFIDGFGLPGSSDGHFKLPWGICVDTNDQIFVADWGNDRIQKFNCEGEFLKAYLGSGEGTDNLRRPAAVCADGDGYIYVADWGNHCVRVFDPNGKPVQFLRGEATLSKWAEEFLDANPSERAVREKSNLEPDIEFVDAHDESSHIEKYFWAPTGVTLNGGSLYVVDSNRHRLQVYDISN